jgi:hypothetical protein
MSERAVQRALQRLGAPSCILAREPRADVFGVFPGGDRRRRPVVRISADEARRLEAEGAIALVDADTYVLSGAGAARARREQAPPSERFAAQHRAISDRAVMDEDGAPRMARGHDPDAGLRRLAALRDGNGAPWLSTAELGAATRLRADWDCAERGLVRGSDWASPPVGETARATNGAEAAMAARCDARRKVDQALSKLAPALRRVVERVCLHEQGLEAMERGESWPARSGKVALKLALSQLASSF